MDLMHRMSWDGVFTVVGSGWMAKSEGNYPGRFGTDVQEE